MDVFWTYYVHYIYMLCPEGEYFHDVLLTFSLPVSRWAGDNTDLPSDINISKSVGVNIAFVGSFLKNIQ